MERKLASIQRISAVDAIENADNLEVASVLGWKCVIKKGAFNAGDLAVYFEVDSFLPVKPQFEFLRKSSYRKNEYLGEGFRVRTAKLRGQISQGLLLSVEEAFKECQTTDLADVEGTDVAGLIGVQKWFMPEVEGGAGTEIQGKANGVPTTDETRIQSIPEMLALFAGKPYYITTKMDGTSCTMSYLNGLVEVAGRNNRYVEDPEKSPMWRYAYKHGIKEKLLALGKNIAIQGEFCGHGIQKNRLRLLEPVWYVFDVFDLDTGKYYGFSALELLCEELGLQTVPIEEKGDSFGYASVEELLTRAEGKYTSGADKEGIVVRTQDPSYDADLRNRYSFKVINNKFLLKEE